MRDATTLLEIRPGGLYCPPGGFFIDPGKPVEKALITHGHADHARAGHEAVMATSQTLDIMAIRYGADFTVGRQIANGSQQVNDVNVSFHPAPRLSMPAAISL